MSDDSEHEHARAADEPRQRAQEAERPPAPGACVARLGPALHATPRSPRRLVALSDMAARSAWTVPGSRRRGARAARRRRALPPRSWPLIIVTDRKISGRASAHQPASGDPRVAARILPRDQQRQLERVVEAELRQLVRRSQRGDHVPPLDRSLEDPVWPALRSRHSSSVGPGGQMRKLEVSGDSAGLRPRVGPLVQGATAVASPGRRRRSRPRACR